MTANKTGIYKRWKERSHKSVFSRDGGDADETTSMSGNIVQLFSTQVQRFASFESSTGLKRNTWQVEVAETGKDGKDQCLTRMCVQRSKTWSRCVKRDSKRRTKCLICIARGVEEVGPGEAVVVVVVGAVEVVVVEILAVVAAGNLVAEVGEVAVEAEGILRVVVVVVGVVALVVEVVKEEEQEEVEVNAGEEDSHEDSIDEFILVLLLIEILYHSLSLVYINFVQRLLIIVSFNVSPIFVFRVLKRKTKNS